MHNYKVFGHASYKDCSKISQTKKRHHLLTSYIQRICRDTKIPDTTGKMFFLRDVIALFLQYLKNEFERCFKMLNIPVQATDFHWVITVPAIWNASGKQMMREAAYQVKCKFIMTTRLQSMELTIHVDNC